MCSKLHSLHSDCRVGSHHVQKTPKRQETPEKSKEANRRASVGGIANRCVPNLFSRRGPTCLIRFSCAGSHQRPVAACMEGHSSPRPKPSMRLSRFLPGNSP